MKRLLAFGLLLMTVVAAQAKSNIVELNRVVAVVNNDVVTAGELQDRLHYIKGQLRKNHTPLPPTDVLTRQVLERLIIERIQLQLADAAGLRVEEAAVNQVINNIAKENKLTLDKLRAVLAKDGLPYADFRQNIRNELLISRLRTRQVTNRVTVTPQEIDTFLAAGAQNNTEYRLSHILIVLPEAPSPEQIQKARTEAEQVLARLRAGADFAQLAIAHSDAQQALEGGDLGWRRGGELPSLFAEEVKSMKKGEVSGLIRSPGGFHIIKLTGVRGGGKKHVIRQTRARHILIQPTELVSDREARQRLERLRQRILNGEKFETLARANSDDKGSASRGGDLGWTSPGQMVAEFERAMKQTALGKISKPFRTQFGWHIVQPLERRNYDNTAEFRRNSAAEALRRRKVEEQTEAWLRQIRDEAYVEYRTE